MCQGLFFFSKTHHLPIGAMGHHVNNTQGPYIYTETAVAYYGPGYRVLCPVAQKPTQNITGLIFLFCVSHGIITDKSMCLKYQ